MIKEIKVRLIRICQLLREIYWGRVCSLAYHAKGKANSKELISLSNLGNVTSGWLCFSSLYLWQSFKQFVLNKFLLELFSLIFLRTKWKQEPCQSLLWFVFSVISSLFILNPFCLRCIPTHYVIPLDFVSTNPGVSMEAINQFSTFWQMTYSLLQWWGWAGRDRKVLQQNYRDEEVLVLVKIMKPEKHIFHIWPWNEMCFRFLFIPSSSQLDQLSGR